MEGTYTARSHAVPRKRVPGKQLAKHSPRRVEFAFQMLLVVTCEVKLHFYKYPVCMCPWTRHCVFSIGSWPTLLVPDARDLHAIKVVRVAVYQPMVRTELREGRGSEHVGWTEAFICWLAQPPVADPIQKWHQWMRPRMNLIAASGRIDNFPHCLSTEVFLFEGNAEQSDCLDAVPTKWRKLPFFCWPFCFLNYPTGQDDAVQMLPYLEHDKVDKARQASLEQHHS